MYAYTTIAKCGCRWPTEDDCTIDSCDCPAYCELYEGTVAGFIAPRYVTFSPDPRLIKDYITLHNDHLDEIFTRLTKCTRDYIVVLEMAGLRPHYHCIFDVTDPIGFNIKLLNYGRYNNVKKHGAFKKGLHYIFKDCKKTFDETGIVPVVERDDVLNRIAAKKREAEKRRDAHRRQYVKELTEGLPKWITEMDVDDDE